MKQFYFLLLIGISIVSAQVQPTTSEKIDESLIAKQAMDTNSLVKNIPLKNIGPSVMSGRVVDLAVNDNNPTEYYVAYASGGLWYTNNNGNTFTPVMDETQTQNLGDIAVHWQSGTIWAGTGENNSSRSSYAGIGILKSTDKGKTWQHMGLSDSHHIGRIIVNPDNANEVTVGVTGHLYSPNEERGIYKTSDGGKTWKKTLFIDNNTGIIDVAVSPNNYQIQYAAAWQKDRKAWNFSGSGEGSGIYKSTDAGTTWTKISTPSSGFPTGEGVGRIGLAVFDDNILYAVHDNQFRREKSKEKKEKQSGLTKDDFKSLSKEQFLALNDKELNEFLKTNNFHEKYRAANVKQMVRSNAVQPADLALYLEDANSMLFDTPVIGAEVYRSNDGGKTWSKQNEDYIDDLFYSYGYYFAQVTVDPNNVDAIYLAGVPIIASKDGGKTYTSINGDNVHADHHALWINPKLPGHLINGNDGGVNTSYDDGKNWFKNNSPTVGQFYAIAVDNEKPYNIYGGLQDNGVWMGPHNAEENSEWQQTGQYPWKSILGGDGMQVEIDDRNANIVYTGYQFGNYFRIDLEKDQRNYIQPKHELGEAPYRFNWQTPILLSPHNQDILYMGSNKMHRSLNKGDTWETISVDLTQGGKQGNVAYGTLTTISESTYKFGLLYTGSDDGLIQRTDNGGGSWITVSNNLPQNLWVSRVIASKHNENRVYATLNGYRSDDFTPYVFVSDDKGSTWKNISNNIPTSAVNVIVEDPENENLLFVGTNNGLYVSLDRGTTWQSFQNGMPYVAIHDLVIQQDAKHLVVGTHGRSIYTANIAAIQNLTSEVQNKALHVYALENIKHSSRWGNSWSSWSKPRTPGLDITFYSDSYDVYEAKIISSDDIVVSETEIIADKGLNVLSYDVAFSKIGKMNYLKKHKTVLKQADNGSTYLPKGTYTIEIKGNGTVEKTTFDIE
ncbi:WD40/YVTN/BNR-like repeat-containing protein [Maribacter sp. 1_2014MBL_MicDiv]|uniref:WD40/YVTN/BNR-like repeat-containing protein n=1 Tax=Maribacter sp. 1_2014MBL_MicDiv TaxID=1644130 RepID=UPI0008F4E5FE|nr:sialidase family protein [Maribacter sp. 1_2014MBL_MicDiv]APA64399.1 glycosyl hydrolase [Maribacter sp. 1_2014MBL_MicDiv]